ASPSLHTFTESSTSLEAGYRASIRAERSRRSLEPRTKVLSATADRPSTHVRTRAARVWGSRSTASETSISPTSAITESARSAMAQFWLLRVQRSRQLLREL